MAVNPDGRSSFTRAGIAVLLAVVLVGGCNRRGAGLSRATPPVVSPQPGRPAAEVATAQGDERAPAQLAIVRDFPKLGVDASSCKDISGGALRCDAIAAVLDRDDGQLVGAAIQRVSGIQSEAECVAAAGAARSNAVKANVWRDAAVAPTSTTFFTDGKLLLAATWMDNQVMGKRCMLRVCDPSANRPAIDCKNLKRHLVIPGSDNGWSKGWSSQAACSATYEESVGDSPRGLVARLRREVAFFNKQERPGPKPGRLTLEEARDATASVGNQDAFVTACEAATNDALAPCRELEFGTDDAKACIVKNALPVFQVIAVERCAKAAKLQSVRDYCAVEEQATKTRLARELGP